MQGCFFQEGETILDRYIIAQLIGRGTYGQVYKCIDTQNGGVAVAVKAMLAQTLLSHARLFQMLCREVNILRQVHHENICQYIALQNDQRYYYLVMHFCNGGNLAQFMHRRSRVTVRKRGVLPPPNYLPESEAIQIIRQILRAFKYLHQHTEKILHRDIKMENIFLDVCEDKPNAKTTIQVGDFGFSRTLNDDQHAITYIGSPLTMAPEIAERQQYDEQCDVYSIGVVFYQLLFGEYPYQHAESRNNPACIAHLVKLGNLDLARNDVQISAACKDLVKRMLEYNPQARITFREIFAHEIVGLDKEQDEKFVVVEPPPVPADAVPQHQSEQATAAAPPTKDKKQTASGVLPIQNPSFQTPVVAVKIAGGKGVGKTTLMQRWRHEKSPECNDVLRGVARRFEFEEVTPECTSVPAQQIRAADVFAVVLDARRGAPAAENAVRAWTHTLVEKGSHEKRQCLVFVLNFAARRDSEHSSSDASLENVLARVCAHFQEQNQGKITCGVIEMSALTGQFTALHAFLSHFFDQDYGPVPDGSGVGAKGNASGHGTVGAEREVNAPPAQASLSLSAVDNQPSGSKKSQSVKISLMGARKSRLDDMIAANENG